MGDLREGDEKGGTRQTQTKRTMATFLLIDESKTSLNFVPTFLQEENP